MKKLHSSLLCIAQTVTYLWFSRSISSFDSVIKFMGATWLLVPPPIYYSSMLCINIACSKLCIRHQYGSIIMTQYCASGIIFYGSISLHHIIDYSSMLWIHGSMLLGNNGLWLNTIISGINIIFMLCIRHHYGCVLCINMAQNNLHHPHS